MLNPFDELPIPCGELRKMGLQFDDYNLLKKQENDLLHVPVYILSSLIFRHQQQHRAKFRMLEKAHAQQPLAWLHGADVRTKCLFDYQPLPDTLNKWWSSLQNTERKQLCTMCEFFYQNILESKIGSQQWLSNFIIEK